MARQAIILYDQQPGPREVFLGRVLDFFGVPWTSVESQQLASSDRVGSDCAIFGSVRSVAGALNRIAGTESPQAFYAYLDDEPDLCLQAIRSLGLGAELSFRQSPPGNLILRVSDQQPDLTGAMTGLQCTLQLGSEHCLLVDNQALSRASVEVIISIENYPIFLKISSSQGTVFLCTSSEMVDIDQPARRGFYDIKDHFGSAAPLVMFIRFAFPEVAWHPQELGACLIIDDPLLRPSYGFCDFAALREKMVRLGFTTNIAFIPWNWRRTSQAAKKFFDFDSGLFSVSVHGCDHTAGEFATTAGKVLDARSRLALSRMRNHEKRTGIKHDPVMVFPQGAFSSVCPAILNRNGFLAAVNTEIAPLDTQNSRTTIRNAWDVAIMAYGDFPIFTRRYAFHGLENFAFDLLLGKPCLIVAHHDSFKNDGHALIDLIEKLGTLNNPLHWRPLGQVIRRACRRRTTTATGTVEFHMYGNELIVENPSDEQMKIKISRRVGRDAPKPQIHCGGKAIEWTKDGEALVFWAQIEPRSEKLFRLLWEETPNLGEERRSLGLEFAVAARRILSEFRDNYLSINEFLSIPAQKLKHVLKRGHLN
jgi:hypothetical protein